MTNLGFFYDIIVEAVLGTVVEGLVGLYSSFVPSSAPSKKVKNIITIIVAITAMLLFVGLVFGIVLLIENSGRSFWGWLLLCLAAAYVIIGIVLTIINHCKKRKDKLT